MWLLLLIFLVTVLGGWLFVRLMLALCGVKPERGAEQRVGLIIGFLERTLIFLAVLAAHWELLLAVIALKTIARYKDLDHKINAEYFLIGSLSSILWAVAWAMFCLKQPGFFLLFQ